MSAKIKAAAQVETVAAAGVVSDQETCPKNTPSRYASQAAWRKRNPKKHWAHVATHSGLKRGLIVQKPCEVCGDIKVDAHHDDYDRPLDVRWLCRKHHKVHHAAVKDGS